MDLSVGGRHGVNSLPDHFGVHAAIQAIQLAKEAKCVSPEMATAFALLSVLCRTHLLNPTASTKCRRLAESIADNTCNPWALASVSSLSAHQCLGTAEWTQLTEHVRAFKTSL